MAKFKTKLRTELVDPEGQGLWRLLVPFAYLSDVLKTIVVVPYNFETDFASVPRLPIAYWLTGNTSHEAAVLHDWLYRKECTMKVTRKQADAVLYEASILSGVPKWRAYLMWSAVRMYSGHLFQAR